MNVLYTLFMVEYVILLYHNSMETLMRIFWVIAWLFMVGLSWKLREIVPSFTDTLMRIFWVIAWLFILCLWWKLREIMPRFTDTLNVLFWFIVGLFMVCLWCKLREIMPSFYIGFCWLLYVYLYSVYGGKNSFNEIFYDWKYYV